MSFELVERIRRTGARIARFRISLFVGLAAVLVSLGWPSWYALRCGYTFEDTWKTVLTTVLGDSGTRFAPGFSEAKFSKVRIGMNRSEVLRILGEPLERLWDDNRLWAFSLDAGKLTYHRRWVFFGTNGNVTGVTRTLYWD